METSDYALAYLANERLAHAREVAARRALLASLTTRAPLRVRLGGALVALGQRLLAEPAAHDEMYPALVAAVGDEIVGFGAIAPYRAKPSYARTVEDSVYVKDGWRGKGVGGLVLDALLERARERGHHSMIARIIADNDASLRLHERHGFVRVGREAHVAFKLGRWLDVLTLQHML